MPRSSLRSRYSDDAEEDEESTREEDEIDDRKRRKDKSMKKRDKASERERNESSHRREKGRRKRSNRRSSTDGEEDERKDRSDNDDYQNGHRRTRAQDDEALPGDAPYNANNPDTDKERDDLISGKGEASTSSKEVSLSVEETNKLRAKLGLKPLNVTEDAAINNGNTKNGATGYIDKEFSHLEVIPGGDVRHNPAENLTGKNAADKLRDKLKRKREKRKQESKLLAVKSLADSSDEDASSWVMSQKQKQEEKERAKKRAQMFEELDDDFGIGSLVDADKKATIKKENDYGSKALAGMKVEHSFERFQEGKNTILTLKDADILDEEAMDTLENVNVVDQERAEKNIVDIKKAKQAYNKFDVEDVDNVTGEIEKKDILYKYDEEIGGVKKKSFVIGKDGQFNQDEADKKRREEIRKKLHGNREAISLNTGAIRLASDYMTQDEVAATKFKKFKKKKKVKTKMLKADDLIDQLEGGKSKDDNERFDQYQDVEMETMPPPFISTKGKKIWIITV